MDITMANNQILRSVLLLIYVSYVTTLDLGEFLCINVKGFNSSITFILNIVLPVTVN